MNLRWPKAPPLTQHGAEVVLLGLIAGGVIWLLGKAIDKSGEGAAPYDLAAFLLVLQAIITAIKDRWQQRGTDRAMTMVGNSAPIAPGLNDPTRPAGTETDPVHVEDIKDSKE